MDRQREAQLRLDSLRLSTFMVEHDITKEDEGLLRLCAYIDKINPQCIPLFRNDTYKLKILSSAVAPFTWATIPRTTELSEIILTPHLKRHWLTP